MNIAKNFQDDAHEFFELKENTTGFIFFEEKTYIDDENSVIVENLKNGSKKLFQRCVNRNTAHLTLELLYNTTLNSIGVLNKRDKLVRLANYGKESFPRII